MKPSSAPDRALAALLGVTSVLVLAGLGEATLWTHEGRWAVICQCMTRTGDFFHPLLLGQEYFDKPLLSYWLMIGGARLFGGLDEFTLRLPSACAGILAVFCVFRIGARLYDRETGLRAGSILATCPMFIYWARQACSDMLSLAAVAAGAAWYVERREKPGGLNALVFFLILAVGAHCKGLISIALTVLVVLPDLLAERRWKAHLRPSTFAALAVGITVYLAPFLVASWKQPPGYHADGLTMVARENLLRFVHAFDHDAPWYVYLHYIPLIALPWTLLLPLVAVRAARRWRELGRESRWPIWAVLLMLALLTASSGRRGYYALPVLPFLALAIADRLREPARFAGKAVAWAVGTCAAGILIGLGIGVPWVSRYGGIRVMAKEVQERADATAPWSDWHVVLYKNKPQMAYYLDAAKEPLRIGEAGELAREIGDYPLSIIITRREWLDEMIRAYPGSTVIVERSRIPGELGTSRTDPEAQTAILVDTLQ